MNKCMVCNGTGKILRDIDSGDSDNCTCGFEMIDCPKCKESQE